MTVLLYVPRRCFLTPFIRHVSVYVLTTLDLPEKHPPKVSIVSLLVTLLKNKTAEPGAKTNTPINGENVFSRPSKRQMCPVHYIQNLPRPPIRAMSQSKPVTA